MTILPASPELSPKPLLITMGDAAGIGPEIIAKAFRDAPGQVHACVVVGDVATLRRAAQLISSHKKTLSVAELGSVQDWPGVPPNCVGVLQACSLPDLPAYGKINAAAGQAAGDCVVFAAHAVLQGQARGMVTAPLHKESLAAAGGAYAGFAGHTELLQAQVARFLQQDISELPVRMMLANEDIKTVLQSIHVPLREALEQVRCAPILQTLQIVHTALGAMLGRPPRIGVAGLNPHAGENGLFGREEIDEIVPAIAAARAAGLDVQGPFAPDTIFMRARHQNGQPDALDVVLAMYHDQGLIPVKYLGIEQGVNVTLGLPLWRTSPDHGTAFDIAGTGQADASSLLAAVSMLRQLSDRGPPAAYVGKKEALVAT